jgi:SAM-dependent methyltransferase
MDYRFKKDNQKIADYYDKLSSSYGNSIKSVGWFNNRTQEIRFLALSLLDDFNQKTVLDVGCGQAAFNNYLQSQGITAKYKGIDISPKMVTSVTNLDSGVDIECVDILDPKFQQKFDYIVSSGAFNRIVQDQYCYVNSILQKMFELANNGVAINLLSARSPDNMKFPASFFYYDPMKVMEICFAITKYVQLKHNYLPNDFTVFLYKN